MRNQEIQCVGRPALRPPPGKPQQHRRRGVPQGHLFHCEGTPPYEATTDRRCVGADDSVRPYDKHSTPNRADTPRALVPLRSTALVVGPYDNTRRNNRKAQPRKGLGDGIEIMFDI